jgi:hypothetical protein
MPFETALKRPEEKILLTELRWLFAFLARPVLLGR